MLMFITKLLVLIKSIVYQKFSPTQDAEVGELLGARIWSPARTTEPDLHL